MHPMAHKKIIHDKAKDKIKAPDFGFLKLPANSLGAIAEPARRLKDQIRPHLELQRELAERARSQALLDEPGREAAAVKRRKAREAIDRAAAIADGRIPPRWAEAFLASLKARGNLDVSPAKNKKRRPGPQERRVLPVLQNLYPPDGQVPDDVATETVRGKVNAKLADETRGKGLREISWDTMARILGRA